MGAEVAWYRGKGNIWGRESRLRRAIAWQNEAFEDLGCFQKCPPLTTGRRATCYCSMHRDSMRRLISCPTAQILDRHLHDAWDRLVFCKAWAVINATISTYARGSPLEMCLLFIHELPQVTISSKGFLETLRDPVV